VIASSFYANRAVVCGSVNLLVGAAYTAGCSKLDTLEFEWWTVLIVINQVFTRTEDTLLSHY